ncbi:hypothetical protein JFK97_19120 [Chromobacterium phragmitis]|uniref:hypothetical protein n=1 Tax=Chromobacterium amazonense TaxID=1382803 RepID=UPI0021B84125|nr:hypothetical protein [Chromobacterium amazonense]MBM2886505.1 hypothetical protein [Chromobacterium amazonense]
MDGTRQQQGGIGLSGDELNAVELWLDEQYQIGPVYTEPFFELIRCQAFWGHQLDLNELHYTPAQREFMGKLWAAYDVEKASRDFHEEMFAAAAYVYEHRLNQPVIREWLAGYVVAHLDQLRASHWLSTGVLLANREATAAEVAKALVGFVLPVNWDFGRWLMQDFLPLHLRLFRAIQIKLETLAEQEAREAVRA